MIECTECDEGYVEIDVSHGDWMAAERRVCNLCNGTKQRLCSYCESRTATGVDEYSDPICEECRNG